MTSLQGPQNLRHLLDGFVTMIHSLQKLCRHMSSLLSLLYVICPAWDRTGELMYSSLGYCQTHCMLAQCKQACIRDTDILHWLQVEAAGRQAGPQQLCRR